MPKMLPPLLYREEKRKAKNEMSQKLQPSAVFFDWDLWYNNSNILKSVGAARKVSGGLERWKQGSFQFRHKGLHSSSLRRRRRLRSSSCGSRCHRRRRRSSRSSRSSSSSSCSSSNNSSSSSSSSIGAVALVPAPAPAPVGVVVVVVVVVMNIIMALPSS